MFHGQTLKSATSDYDERHVIAFRPISVAARSWSYDKTKSCIHQSKQIYYNTKKQKPGLVASYNIWHINEVSALHEFDTYSLTYLDTYPLT